MKYDFLVDKRTDLNNLAFTDTQLSIIEQEFDLIPVSVMNKFFFEGWKIVAVNNDADFEGNGINVAGQVYIPKRHLYMKKTLSDSVFRDTISHEMGHILDVFFRQGAYTFYAGASFKSDKEQAKINTLWNTECSSWGSHYQDRNEFFAEAFRRYVKGRLITEIETKKWIEGFIKSQSNYYTENINLMFENSITNVVEQPDFNQIHFLNRYGKKIGYFTFPQNIGGGSGTSENNVLYSNTYNESSKYTDFPETYYEIVSSYATSVNGNWGVAELRTFKKGFNDQGVKAYQIKTFVFGDPNTEPLRFHRYAEDNVSRNWSQWYDMKGSGSGGSSPSYVLPVATASTLGGVTTGENVLIEADGTLSIELATHTIPGVAKFSSADFDVNSGNVKIKANAIVNKTISSGILTLGTERYQKCTMLDATEIKLPTVIAYTQIELHFSTTSELTLIFPNVAWQTIPAIKSNKDYIIIFTYNGTKWLGGCVEYGS